MPCLHAPLKRFWDAHENAQQEIKHAFVQREPRSTLFEEPFAKLASAHAAEQSEFISQCKQRAPLSHLSGPPDAARGTVTGHARMAILRKTLDSFGLVRSKNQREFHREMIKAALPLIYKTDLDEHLDDLLREFEATELKSEVMIITPRRWGKTYSVAMFVVACAASIENVEQAIFSTGRRASKKLLDLIYKLLRKIPWLRDSVIVRNVETIWIRGPGGDIRKIYSYPSKVSALPCLCFVACSNAFNEKKTPTALDATNGQS